MFYQTQKCALFIDGQSLFYACRELGFAVDYQALRDYFAKATMLARAKFYALDRVVDGHSPLRRTVDWLTHNGFSPVILDQPAVECAGAAKHRQSVLNGHKAVDALSMGGAIDHAVFIDNSPSLIPVIAALQAQAVTVTVISTIQTEEPMIGQDLRRAADHFLDVNDLARSIQFEPAPASAA